MEVERYLGLRARIVAVVIAKPVAATLAEHTLSHHQSATTLDRLRFVLATLILDPDIPFVHRVLRMDPDGVVVYAMYFVRLDQRAEAPTQRYYETQLDPHVAKQVRTCSNGKNKSAWIWVQWTREFPLDHTASAGCVAGHGPH